MHLSSDFFRFPHTPHLKWLGADSPREDKILSRQEAESLLSGEISVEEKIDGANIGFSVSPNGALRVQNRGDYLKKPFHGQFSRLHDWMPARTGDLKNALHGGLILFGEWCAARHSVSYETLPDWFLIFDVYDREAGKFWCVERRNSLAQRLGLKIVPQLARGRFTLSRLESLLANTRSRHGNDFAEGMVIRRDGPAFLEARAKLVRADFTQSIEEHWRKRGIRWNRLNYGTPSDRFAS